MHLETEGIILKQNKILEDRRMLTIFTKKYGKLQSGAAANASRSKTKSSLAFKPFTLGKYELYKGRGLYQINSGEAAKSFYRIGEDIEKYAYASYALELTEKILPEEEPAPRIYELLCEFLEVIEKRAREYVTIVAAYQLKLIKYSGSMPQTKSCVRCTAAPDERFFFHIPEGGLLCQKCMGTIRNDALIYSVNPAIINVVNYILAHSLTALAGVKIEEKALDTIHRIAKQYIKYHYGIGSLKSESFILMPSMPGPMIDMV